MKSFSVGTNLKTLKKNIIISIASKRTNQAKTKKNQQTKIFREKGISILYSIHSYKRNQRHSVRHCVSEDARAEKG